MIAQKLLRNRLRSAIYVPYKEVNNYGISVGDMVEKYFSDANGDKLGMMVYMAQTSKLGMFEYSRDNGLTWTAIGNLPYVSVRWRELYQVVKAALADGTETATKIGSNIRVKTIQALYLAADTRIRYAPAKGVNVWSNKDARRNTNIVFAACDGTDVKLKAGGTQEVSFPLCKECGDRSSISKGFAQIYVRRLGCDGRFGSRATCSGVCRRRNRCMDCNGDLNGGAKRDACGVCYGGNTGRVANETLDCSGKCRQRKDWIVDPNDKTCKICANKKLSFTEAKITKPCDVICEGKTPLIRSVCGVCSLDPLDGKDKCGICGGKDECLDCKGVPNGNHEVDTCGVCRLPSDPAFDTGCDGLSVESPVYLTEGESSSIVIRTSRTKVLSKLTKVSSCVLAKDTLTVEVTNITLGKQKFFINAREIPSGDYTLKCTFSSSTLNRTLSSASTVTIYPPCKVSSVSPTTIHVGQKAKVSLSGEDIPPTNGYCFVKCTEDLAALEQCSSGLENAFIKVPTSRNDSSLVTCDLTKFSRLRKESVLHMGYEPTPGVRW